MRYAILLLALSGCTSEVVQDKPLPTCTDSQARQQLDAYAVCEGTWTAEGCEVKAVRLVRCRVVE